MKRFLAIVTATILLGEHCYAIKPFDCSFIPRYVFGDDDCSQFMLNTDRAAYLNSLIGRVWNKDFGKLVQVFCEYFFRKRELPDAPVGDLDKILFTFRTIEIMELVMSYLCTASPRKCIEFLGGFVSFFKNRLRNESQKSAVLDRFREFVCCALIGLFRYESVTGDLISEKNRIMSDLYG